MLKKSSGNAPTCPGIGGALVCPCGMAERVGSSGGAAGGPDCIIAAGGMGEAMILYLYFFIEELPEELPPRFSEPAFTLPLVY
jgi:hypothetical protein